MNSNLVAAHTVYTVHMAKSWMGNRVRKGNKDSQLEHKRKLGEHKVLHKARKGKVLGKDKDRRLQEHKRKEEDRVDIRSLFHNNLPFFKQGLEEITQKFGKNMSNIFKN